MSQKTLTKLINKMINVIKPNGVSDIKFRLDPMSIRDDEEYYLSITYIVPDDSEFLRSVSMRDSDIYRQKWNDEIRNMIKNYFNTRVIINASGIMSQSYYDNIKEL